MIYLSIAFFALAAVLGLTILMKWLTKKEASRTVVYAHGLAAVVALVLLIVYAMQHPESFPTLSLVLFAVAAVAGLYLFFLDLKKKPNPLAIAFIHGLVAVTAFVLLLLFVFA